MKPTPHEARERLLIATAEGAAAALAHLIGHGTHDRRAQRAYDALMTTLCDVERAPPLVDLQRERELMEAPGARAPKITAEMVSAAIARCGNVAFTPSDLADELNKALA